MRYRALAIGIVAALPLGLLVAWSMTQTLRQFSDPCFEWGLSQPVGMSISPEGPCRAIGGTSETKVHALLRLILVHGGILIAAALTILGALLARPFLGVFGAGLILLESIPLIFSFAWLTALTSGLFLLAARESGPIQGPAQAGARLVGFLGGLGLLLFVPALLTGAPLFLLQVLALAFVAIVGWWPVRAQSSS